MIVSVAPSNAGIGAEVHGVDLREPVAGDTLAAIRKALNDHAVIVFRDQRIDEPQQIAFSRHFGALATFHEPDKRSATAPEIFRIANVVQQGGALRDDGDPVQSYFTNITQRWHTDGSYKAVPAYATTLYGLEVPPVGADTLFADMFSAYDALPDATKRHLDGRQMVHNYENNMRITPDHRPMSAADKALLPPVTHPVVRRYPDGRKSLYLSGNVAEYVGGMTVEEGRVLLRELVTWATQPRFIYRHKWRPRDLLMWDNRGVMHQATPYDRRRYRRIMLRTEIIGDGAPV